MVATFSTRVRWREYLGNQPTSVSASTSSPPASPSATTFEYPRLANVSLFNAEGSGKVVKLREVSLCDRVVTSTDARVPASIGLFVGSVDDTATSAHEVVPVGKFDTDAPDLPAQVRVVMGVYQSGGTYGLVRRSAIPFQVNFNGAISNPLFMRMRPQTGILASCRFTGDATPFVARAGENLTMTLQVGTFHTVHKALQVQCTFDVDGESYHFSCLLPPAPGASAAFGGWLAGYTHGPVIVNGTGSGVVVKLVSLEVYEVTADVTGAANSNLSGPVVYVRPFSYYAKGQEVSIVTPYDSNEALPAGVKVLRNAIVTFTVPDALIGEPDLALRRLRYTGHGLNLTALTQGHGFSDRRKTTIYEGCHALNEGDGLAIYQGGEASIALNADLVGGGTSGYGDWDVDLIFTVEDGAAPPGGGSVGYSRARVSNG